MPQYHISVAIDPIPQLKEQLRQEILSIANRYTVTHAAMELEIATASMSRIRSGNLERFSLEKLIRILAVVQRRVEISVIDESGIVTLERNLARSRARNTLKDGGRGGV